MIKEINHDPIILARKSVPATMEDLQTAIDLYDTLDANRAGCVGMAANMIGINKRIIVFVENDTIVTMFNPEIIKQQGSYEAEEGCLSLTGKRKTKRFKTIKVRWQNEEFKTRIMTFKGFTAEIIQHEIDHCNGILI